MLFPNFKERMKNLQSKMSAADLKAILITTRGALIYFTGTFFLWRTALVLGVNSNPILVTLNYDVERLKTQTWIKDIITWEFGLNKDFLMFLLQENYK